MGKRRLLIVAALLPVLLVGGLGLWLLGGTGEGDPGISATTPSGAMSRRGRGSTGEGSGAMGARRAGDGSTTATVRSSTVIDRDPGSTGRPSPSSSTGSDSGSSRADAEGPEQAGGDGTSARQFEIKTGIRGRVLLGKEPVGGVTVFVAWAASFASLENAFGGSIPMEGSGSEVKTDKQGRYLIETVPGVHRLVASRPGFEVAMTPRLRVKPSELVEAPDMILEGMKQGAMVLLLRTPEGEPIRGKVSSFGKPPEAQGRRRIVMGEWLTDADGRVGPIPTRPGEHRFKLSVRGWTSDEVTVVVREGKTVEQLVRFPDSPSLFLTIRDRATGEPVPEIQIHGQFEGTNRTVSGVSDEAGRLRLADLQPGSLELMLTSAGWSGFEVDGRVMSKFKLALKASDFGGRRELRLVRGDTLTGVVLSPEGEPATGRMVITESSREPRTIPIREDGTFEIPGWGFEGAQVVIRSELYGLLVEDVRHGRSGLEEGLILRFKPPIRRRLRIVDAAGVPVPLAQVSVNIQPPVYLPPYRGPEGVAMLADESGLAVTPPLQPGTFQLVVAAEGMRTLTREPVDWSGADAGSGGEERIELERGGTLRGRITGYRPDAGANLRWYRTDGTMEEPDPVALTLSADGTFVIKGLAEAPYRLELAVVDLPMAESVVARPGDADVTLIWRAPAVLNLQILGPGGELASTYVGLSWPKADGGDFWKRGEETDEQGRVELSLPPDRTDVRIEVAGHRTVTLFPTGPGSGVRIERTVRVELGGILRGRLVSPQGEALTVAWISVTQDGRRFSGRTDAEGRFSIEGTSAGAAQLMIYAGHHGVRRPESVTALESGVRELGDLVVGAPEAPKSETESAPTSDGG